MATRQAVKSVNKSTTEIAANAAAEKARKLASKAALKATEVAAKPKTTRKPKAPTVTPQVITTDALEAKRATEAANTLKSQREDYEALDLGGDVPFESYLADQGFNLDGTPRAASAVAKAGSYQGPMLALRTAAQHYTKGANGNPHCNDWLASSLAGLTREQVVACLIAAMKLPGNPYPHLNPGQQSMNLRNKARGMAKAGLLTQGDLDAVIERQSRHA